jgi:hypothetical protein
MATRAYTAERCGPGFEAVAVTWSGLLNTDDGTPFEMVAGRDRSVQFQGTFGTGGTIVLEGSNDGTNYQTLADPSSTAISKTAASIEQVLEFTRFVRPRVTGGDGSTNLVCTMIFGR